MAMPRIGFSLMVLLCLTACGGGSSGGGASSGGPGSIAPDDTFGGESFQDLQIASLEQRFEASARAAYSADVSPIVLNEASLKSLADELVNNELISDALGIKQFLYESKGVPLEEEPISLLPDGQLRPDEVVRIQCGFGGYVDGKLAEDGNTVKKMVFEAHNCAFSQQNEFAGNYGVVYSVTGSSTVITIFYDGLTISENGSRSTLTGYQRLTDQSPKETNYLYATVRDENSGYQVLFDSITLIATNQMPETIHGTLYLPGMGMVSVDGRYQKRNDYYFERLDFADIAIAGVGESGALLQITPGQIKLALTQSDSLPVSGLLLARPEVDTSIDFEHEFLGVETIDFDVEFFSASWPPYDVYLKGGNLSFYPPSNVFDFDAENQPHVGVAVSVNGAPWRCESDESGMLDDVRFGDEVLFAFCAYSGDDFSTSSTYSVSIADSPSVWKVYTQGVQENGNYRFFAGLYDPDELDEVLPGTLQSHHASMSYLGGGVFEYAPPVGQGYTEYLIELQRPDTGVSEVFHLPVVHAEIDQNAEVALLSRGVSEYLPVNFDDRPMLSSIESKVFNLYEMADGVLSLKKRIALPELLYSEEMKVAGKPTLLLVGNDWIALQTEDLSRLQYYPSAEGFDFTTSFSVFDYDGDGTDELFYSARENYRNYVKVVAIGTGELRHQFEVPDFVNYDIAVGSIGKTGACRVAIDDSVYSCTGDFLRDIGERGFYEIELFDVDSDGAEEILAAQFVGSSLYDFESGTIHALSDQGNSNQVVATKSDDGAVVIASYSLGKVRYFGWDEGLVLHSEVESGYSTYLGDYKMFGGLGYLSFSNGIEYHGYNGNDTPIPKIANYNQVYYLGEYDGREYFSATGHSENPNQLDFISRDLVSNTFQTVYQTGVSPWFNLPSGLVDIDSDGQQDLWSVIGYGFKVISLSDSSILCAIENERVSHSEELVFVQSAGLSKKVAIKKNGAWLNSYDCDSGMPIESIQWPLDNPAWVADEDALYIAAQGQLQKVVFIDGVMNVELAGDYYCSHLDAFYDNNEFRLGCYDARPDAQKVYMLKEENGAFVEVSTTEVADDVTINGKDMFKVVSGHIFIADSKWLFTLRVGADAATSKRFIGLPAKGLKRVNGRVLWVHEGGYLQIH